MTRTLPVEILGSIFEDLISDYAEDDERFKLLPRWYLLPLLLVCKLWYSVSERHLYRSIVIGSSMRRAQIAVSESDPAYPPEPRQRSTSPQLFPLGPSRPRTPVPTVPKRLPYEIAGDLLLALEGNSRHAALVNELQLHWPARFNGHVALIMRIFSICPNLQHVGLLLKTIDALETDVLCTALAERSLVTFGIELTDSPQIMPFPFYDLLRSWPEVRKISINTPGGQGQRLVEHADSQAPEAINCCPELREIKLSSQYLREGDLTPLRAMCRAVTKLDICAVSRDTQSLDALCGCLHAWSPNLESLSVKFGSLSQVYYHPLSEALASLTSLRSLIIRSFHLDFDAISSLRQLARITCHQPPNDTFRLVHLLEDPDTFTALTRISFWSVGWAQDRSVVVELRDVCCRRNIELGTCFSVFGSF